MHGTDLPASVYKLACRPTLPLPLSPSSPATIPHSPHPSSIITLVTEIAVGRFSLVHPVRCLVLMTQHYPYLLFGICSQPQSMLVALGTQCRQYYTTSV
jgi:hypothetical protein